MFLISNFNKSGIDICGNLGDPTNREMPVILYKIYLMNQTFTNYFFHLSKSLE